MIPLLERGKPVYRDGRPVFQKTLADTELKDCNAIRFRYADFDIDVWKYLEAYGRIIDKSAKKSTFPLNPAQILIYKAMDEQMAKKGYVRLNVAKGRQMGSSTLIEAVFWTKMVTCPGFKVAILADTQSKGRGLLEKYKFLYENTPDELKKALKKAERTNNSDMLSFDFGGGMVSSVQVIVANENAGASYTFQAIHESEVALWENIGSTILALEQTVGAFEPGTMIVRETTARGPNEWKSYYEKGKSGRSDFKSLFLVWWLDPRYRRPYDGHELSKYEKMLVKRGCPLDAVQWYQDTLSNIGGNVRYMKQEYPSTEAEMWESSAIGVFDPNLVATRKEQTASECLMRGDYEWDDAIQLDDQIDGAIELTEPHFIKSDYGSTVIYEAPIPGHPYALVNDPAKGGEDYYATHVFDCSTTKQVAVYHARNVTAKEAAFQCHLLGEYYRMKDESGHENRVWHSGERNATKSYLRYLIRLGDEVVRDQTDSENPDVVAELGWRTTVANRRAMIDKATTWFEETKGNLVTDYETLCEMESFQYKRSGINGEEKAQAIGGAHDDLVMALVGFFWCLDRGDFETDVQSWTPKAKQKYNFDPFARTETKKSSHFQEW